MKKFIVLLLVIMIFPVQTAFYATAENQADDCREELSALIDFSILNADEYDDSDSFSDNVTRGEFAYAIYRIMNAGGGFGAGYQISFKDVSDEYIDIIGALASLKLFTGYDRETFGWDDKITLEQAAKVSVVLTGYDRPAQALGGWPSGYLLKASELKLLDSAMKAPYITKRDFIKMLYRVLFVDIMKQTSFGVDYIIKVQKGDTLLSGVMKIGEVKNARITANSQTAVSGTALPKGQIEAESIRYFKGETNADEYIGKRVRLFYDNSYPDTQIKTIKHICLYQKIDELTIDFSDIAASDRQNNRIEYYIKEDTTKFALISQYADMLYNGRFVPFDISLISKGEDGSVVLYDTSDEGKYDLVSVKKYTNIYVSGVDYDKRTIYGKYGNINLSKVTDDNLKIIGANGSSDEYFLDDITVGNLLSVYMSLDNEQAEIYINSGSVAGNIGEISEDRHTLYTIDANVYKTSSYMKNFPNLKIGDEGIFYFDISGKIAYADIGRISSLKYGFVIAMAEKKGLSSSNYQIKILKENGDISIFDIKDKIIFGDEADKISDSDLYNRLLITDKGSPEASRRQLIRYRLSADGVIVEIQTPKSQKLNDDDFVISHPYKDGQKTKFNSTIKSFNLKFAVDDKTVMFLVPVSPDSNDEEYDVIAPSYFAHDESYGVESYSEDKGGVAKVLAAWTNSATRVSPGQDSPLVLVDKISESVNEKGEMTQKLYGVSGGRYVQYNAIDNEMLVKSAAVPLKKGDVVRISLNKKSEICGLLVDIDNENERHANKMTANALSTFWAFTGVVYSQESGYAKVSNTTNRDLSLINFGIEGALYSLKLGGSVSVYDEAANKVYAGSTDDIYDYLTAGSNAARFYGRFRYETPRDFIIFKFKD